MLLQADRPIVFFDLETTGLSVQNDRIIEYSFVKIQPDGSRSSLSGYLNPTVKISEESISIHGITPEMVQNSPTFADKADEFIAFISNCDFGGFNIVNFDIPMLDREFKRAKKNFNFELASLVDAQKIFFKKEPRTLSAALNFYCGKDHTGAHGAEADVLATIDVLEAQLDKYDDLPKSAAEIHKFCRECNPNFVEPTGRIRWMGDDAVVAFKSNFQNQRLQDIATLPKGQQFLRWIMNNNFSLEVKTICQDALNGKFPKK